MQQGRFRRDGMMIHHPGEQPTGYVPNLVTRGVDQFCLAGMVWSWKALKLIWAAIMTMPVLPATSAIVRTGSRRCLTLDLSCSLKKYLQCGDGFRRALRFERCKEYRTFAS
jgi:hypothetical protein